MPLSIFKHIIMNQVRILILILFVFVGAQTSANERDSIQYKFTESGSGYSFHGSFRIKANARCLIDVVFQHQHIRALAIEANEVILIDKGESWNKIAYTYQRFHFFENKSVWLRNLDEDSLRVDFTLVSSENNRAIMPDMTSSSGYYKITPHSKYCIVEYFQKCLLSAEVLSKPTIKAAKREAIEFIYWFSEYANRICIQD